MTFGLDRPHPTLSSLVRLRVRLIWPEVVAIQFCVLIAALARGLDYLLPPHADARTLSVIEQVMPVWWWGILFILGAVLGLAGLVVDRYPVSFAGHAVLVAVYAGFTVGAMCDVATRSPIEGWRTPADWLLVFVVVHWGFADAAIDVWRERRQRE